MTDIGIYTWESGQVELVVGVTLVQDCGFIKREMQMGVVLEHGRYPLYAVS